ncbi:hypothetical protein [Bradyrhizobium sp. Ec3.3]|uniref:hypothetical protein n=1 Tax=Bradyrhizobium sp. Ec3.3 TaxID=189753 RepID=UPI0012EB614F|nr:hypothetical protein [Bradyrhizobium sp. Ec3.3]
MATNFILRSPYLPSNRSTYRLDAPSPLAWFQSIWPRLREDAGISSKELLNVENLYYFAGFAENVRDKGLAAPANMVDLQTLLSHNWYGIVECRDGYVFIETDDDEVQLAFWWVSDEVLEAEQERFACYSADRLPPETGSGGFDPGCGIALAGNVGGVGSVFGVFATVWDGGNLLDLPGPIEVRGLRLPEFAGWLRAVPPGKITIPGLLPPGLKVDHLLELEWMALIARHNPELNVPALLRRLGEVSPTNVDKHCEEMAAGTLTEDELRKEPRWHRRDEPSISLQDNAHSVELRLSDGFCTHVWFLFDDLWASAHPVLARSLLRFGLPISQEVWAERHP